ncbi:MAG: hypothetical protein V1674_02315 [Candidatus Omnitrophota bacterium]
MTKKIVNLFAFIEIFIGGITLSSVIAGLVTSNSTKPLNVLIFVVCTSIISFFLGVGLLIRNPQAYHIILYFAFAIIVTKILIFTHIITLHGALETNIPASFKNLVSLIYHSLILVFFNLEGPRKEFIKT